MNKKKLTIVKWICEIILIIALSFMYYLNKSVETSKVLYIPSGSITKIITHLHHKKVDVSPLDGYLLRLIGQPQQGWISINKHRLTHADFLYKLTTAKAAMKDITLIPGETTEIFLQDLAKEMKLSLNKLKNAYHHLTLLKEGAFVPETYKLPLGITEYVAIKLLLDQSSLQMRRWATKIFGLYNERKWFHYVTMASVIQKEAASIEEMPVIASVIQNRLHKGMRLQMDGTLNYGNYSHQRVTAERIRNDRSLYNTYKHKGLPPYPVCNVSFEAIKAAIFPAKTDYLYFVKAKNGKHKFSRNYSTHLRNIKHVTK